MNDRMSNSLTGLHKLQLEYKKREEMPEYRWVIDANNVCKDKPVSEYMKELKEAYDSLQDGKPNTYTWEGGPKNATCTSKKCRSLPKAGLILNDSWTVNLRKTKE